MEYGGIKGCLVQVPKTISVNENACTTKVMVLGEKEKSEYEVDVDGRQTEHVVVLKRLRFESVEPGIGGVKC